MMLEVRKMKLEQMKVSCAKEEMECRILERMEDINRLKQNIEVQNKRIVELDELIKDKE